MRNPLTIISYFESDLEKLNTFKREKRFTPCLELLGKHGLVGDLAIFILSQINETWLYFGSGELTKRENQGGQR
ncbi:MAG TPA: hypothetical protein V6D37_10260 [Candidatus Sericytochromatia bacterium]